MTDPRMELGDCGHVVIHGSAKDVHLDVLDAWEIGFAFFSSRNPGALAGRLLDIESQARDQLADRALNLLGDLEGR
jgi:hypothetical protein